MGDRLRLRLRVHWDCGVDIMRRTKQSVFLTSEDTMICVYLSAGDDEEYAGKAAALQAMLKDGVKFVAEQSELVSTGIYEMRGMLQ